jgi:molecular chaperone GrpE
MIEEENQATNVQGSTVESADGVATSAVEGNGDSTAQAVAEEALPTLGEVEFTEPTSEGEETSQDQTKLAAAIAQLEGENKSLKSQLEDRNGQYMRIAADFDNFRRRTQREKEDLEVQIKCATINELLPVVDSFDRARSHIKPQTDQETTINDSYQSVYKQLVDCLKRIGVSPMRAKGKEFDPNLHEAVMRQPTDEFAEGIVMEELQRGYMLGDRVLRHALVKVAAAPEPMISLEENADQGTSES